MQNIHFEKNGKTHFEQLKEHIIVKAEDAKKDKQLFDYLVKDICYSKGYGFKSGVKIKNSLNTASIFRTIEKLIEDKFYQLQSIKYCSIKDDGQKTSFQKYIKSLICEEKEITHYIIEEILNKEASFVF